MEMQEHRQLLHPTVHIPRNTVSATLPQEPLLRIEAVHAVELGAEEAVVMAAAAAAAAAVAVLGIMEVTEAETTVVVTAAPQPREEAGKRLL